ncbi:hypothetical protein FACS1894217_00470 [Clostridia bacterium]|nr:hypothetical protein FACS1894217_00470 [Clostridia bacterium]
MEWITNWWNELGALGRILACAAIPGTILMAIQTVLLLIGGDLGPDADGNADIGDDPSDLAQSSDGLQVFTVRGVIALLAIGGWTGLAVWGSTRSEVPTIISAVLAGTAALVLAAFIVKWSLKLQETGNVNPRNAIAQLATVYIPVRPNRESTGRVTLTLQGRFVEMDAVTDDGGTLKTGETVQVVGLQGSSTLVVKGMSYGGV